MAKLKIENIVKPSIKKIAKYIPGESASENKKEFIKLSSNESPFEIPKRIFSKINHVIKKANEYPDGDSLNLKETISNKFNINKNQIICGNGSDDILSIICQTFSREGDEVICSEYGFIYYPIIARAAGCNVVTAKTKNLSVSTQNILKKINKKTKLIFIANPNNPTGSIIFRDELIDFLNKVPKDIIVVLDGAYSEFIIDKDYSDGLDLIKKYQNLIVTRTFSKIFALAGFRLGWGCSNKNIINFMERVRGPFNVNSIAQHIGSLILNEDKFIEKSIKHNEKWKNILIRKFNDFDLYTEASYTNFLLVKVPKKFSKNKLLKNLKKNKILVRDLENYNLKNYFRVSIGTNSQMTRFLRVLEKILNKL